MSRPAFRAAIAVAGGPPASFSGIEPEGLHAVLRRHKLVARTQHISGLTPEQRGALRNHWQAAAARCLMQQAECERLVDGLLESGIPVMPYKGIVLQRWLTGSVLGRDSEDLDLYVPSTHFRDAIRWLLADGYTLAFDLDIDALRGPLPSELLLLHPGGMHLDLHQRFFARHYALDAVEPLLGARVPGVWEDEVTAWMVLLSAGKDGWPTLRHLADIADAVERVDSAVLAGLSDRTHTRGLVDAGVSLVQRVLGRLVDWPVRYPLPGGASNALVLEGPVPRIAASRTYLSCRERTRDQLRFILRVPFKVSAVDRPESGGLQRLLHRSSRLLRTHGPSALQSPLRRTDVG